MDKIHAKEDVYTNNFAADLKKKEDNQKIMEMKKMINGIIENIRAKNLVKLK